MISALSRTGPRAVPDTKKLLPALAAALLGMAILFGVALANGDTIHNAAIVATAIANAVFWVVLGAGCAGAFRKLA